MNDINKNLVIVDDEIEILELLQDLLEDEGFSIQTFDKAEAAIEYLMDKPKVDIILSDYHMKEIDGLSFLRKINAEKLYSGKFYLCTGDMNFDSKEFKDIGGTDIITKPYDIDYLIEFLKK
ncbi:response regulator [Bacteriovoracaceae bacterium]|nr:response regulator [Bacteriovoracaceae bacterium]